MEKIYTIKCSLGGHILYPLTKAQILVIWFFLSLMPFMKTFQLKSVFSQKSELKSSSEKKVIFGSCKGNT